MQLFALLLITLLDYASSDPANCEVTFMESKTDNPYIDVELDEKFHVDTVKILKEMKSDKGFKVFYDVSNQQAMDTDEESIDLCDKTPSEVDTARLELLRQSLGLDSLNCPIKPTTVKKPPKSFKCQYQFGDTEDSVIFLDFSIKLGDDSICDVSISVIKPEADHGSDN